MIRSIHADLKKKLKKINTTIAKAMLTEEFEKETKWIDFLGISENNPEYISYLTKDRWERICDDKDCGELVWDKSKRFHIKPSKVVELMFPGKFKDKEKEDFTLAFRNEVKKDAVQSDYFKIVEGKDIQKYYLSETYLNYKDIDQDEDDDYDDDDRGDDEYYDGNLFDSCMRYRECKSYFKLYTENPKQVKMAVVFNEEEKVMGRCILWVKEKVTYYDRIYFYSQKVAKMFQAALDKSGYINASPKNLIAGDSRDLFVELEKTDFDYYPYMDTFAYLNVKNNTIYSEKPRKATHHIQHTDGCYDDISQGRCPSCGNRVDEDYVFIGCPLQDSREGCDSCTIYSEHYKAHIYTPACTKIRGIYYLSRDVCATTDYNYELKVNCIQLPGSGEWARPGSDRIGYTEEGELFDTYFKQDIVTIAGKHYSIYGSLVVKGAFGRYKLREEELVC